MKMCLYFAAMTAHQNQAIMNARDAKNAIGLSVLHV